MTSQINGPMKVLPAAKFKEQCLALLDSVDSEGIVITKRGKPVARLIPIERQGKSLIGALKGRISVHGDLLSTGVRSSTSVVHSVPLLTRDRRIRKSRRVPFPRT